MAGLSSSYGEGEALDAVDKLVKIKGVKSARAITGVYDIIATFQVDDVATIGGLVCKGSARAVKRGFMYADSGLCRMQNSLTLTPFSFEKDSILHLLGSHLFEPSRLTYKLGSILYQDR